MRWILAAILITSALGSPWSLASPLACLQQLTKHNPKNQSSLLKTERPWPEIQERLHAALSQQSKLELETTTALLSSTRFFDYEDTASPFLNSISTHSLADVLAIVATEYGGTFVKSASWNSLWKILNMQPRDCAFECKGPFANFLYTEEWLKNQRPEVSPFLLEQIQAEMMAGGIGYATEADISQYRSSNVVGRVILPGPSLTPEQVKNIDQSPYLNFTIQDRLPNRQLLGNIEYPHPSHLKPELLQLLKNFRPSVLRQLNRTSYALLIKTLTEERFTRFQRDLHQLGALDSEDKKLSYIDLVALFQRDLVSIHPFKDGNGRSTRALMNYLLTKQGIPPARVLNPELDIFGTPEDWTREVRSGVRSTYLLYSDMLSRLENNLPLENSPWLLVPDLPEEVGISLKRQDSEKETFHYKLASVDPNQFTAYVRTYMQLNPEWGSELRQQTLQKISELVSKFVTFYQLKTIEYNHSKDGARELKQRLVDADFTHIFARPTAMNKARWSWKMQRWFSPELLWRGLSNRRYEYTDLDLLRHFKVVTGAMASNRLVGLRTGNSETLRAEALKDFNAFNLELVNGKYVELARDHSTSGPRYASSYAYSTSKKESIGRDFAMGAMVIAPYGRHQAPEYQSQLKSRINIGVRRAQHDVDLTRMKVFSPEFSNRYPRQQEVLGIGAADPDAVTVVQRINAEGEVIHSFVRDPIDPNIVRKISGHFIPVDGEPIPAQLILASFRLFE